MMMAPNTFRTHDMIKHVTLALIGLLWMAGCATRTSELRQEIEVLLQQTINEIRQETDRMDTEMAHLRSEVVQLRSELGHVDSQVGRVGSEIRQFGSEIALLQRDMRKNDSSLVDLAVHVNQLDRRLARTEKASLQNGERVARPSDERDNPAGQQGTEAAVSPSLQEPTKALKHGMPQQDVRRLFGNPHGMERILDSIYWYYADGELKGQYVRFDATTGYVNGWSTFSPQYFQIDLRTTPGSHVR